MDWYFVTDISAQPPGPILLPTFWHNIPVPFRYRHFGTTARSHFVTHISAQPPGPFCYRHFGTIYRSHFVTDISAQPPGPILLPTFRHNRPVPFCYRRFGTTDRAHIQSSSHIYRFEHLYLGNHLELDTLSYQLFLTVTNNITSKNICLSS